MSTYILMKVLEFVPQRYERGIRALTIWSLGKAYDRLMSNIGRGQKVLDLGCGTGALTLRAAQKGAKVKGIDVNPQMLEVARKRSIEAGLSVNIELFEMGVAELGREESESYDVVMSGLCFSELTENELNYALKEIKRILKPRGSLLVADEVRPKNISKRILALLIRFPLEIITYLITQTTTKPVENLSEKIMKEGLIVESVRSNKLESFIEMVVRKPRRRQDGSH
jgi:ubiquinone/menaquinone biosynthesis C-methylase UbiE